MLNSRSLGARLGAFALTVSLSLALLALHAGPVRADVPDFISSSGITVTGSRPVTSRTLEVDVSTPYISRRALNAPNRIRVILPDGYFEHPDRRYPVLYLLHGGAGGSASAWTTAGDAEQITAGKDVITVMPDGGRVSWFTNWIDQSQGAQRWADFYLTQVIPWTDANLRTIAERRGRAIAGLSMGGYGAVRLAQDRPDMFASVASFSGAVDLGEAGTRLVIVEQALQNGLSPLGPFGVPLWPFDRVWRAEDPMRRAARLRDMQVLLYAGNGVSDIDIIERTMQDSAQHFAKALRAADVPFFMWLYGRPGATGSYTCDGGHDWGCWNFALTDALPRILGELSPAT
jgi:S-formylglutathione hydrolase FrmB